MPASLANPRADPAHDAKPSNAGEPPRSKTPQRMEAIVLPQLDRASIEAIAVRVVELLREQAATPGRMLSATEVARRYGVSRSWVYEHAERLGAFRLGTGPRARLRFSAAEVSARVEGLRAAPDAPVFSRRRTHWIDADDLIPVRGRTQTA